MECSNLPVNNEPVACNPVFDYYRYSGEMWGRPLIVSSEIYDWYLSYLGISRTIRMPNPKASAVKLLIEKFKKVFFIYKDSELNMSCPHVNMAHDRFDDDYGLHTGHKCGTVHCHGGWYAIASGLHLQGDVDYISGAQQMAKDLGFAGRHEIAQWAQQNPEIWGNEFGNEMFGDERAFIDPHKRPDGALSNSHIVDHWTEVHARLLALEMPVQKYEDITADLAVLPIEETPDTITTKTLHYDKV